MILPQQGIILNASGQEAKAKNSVYSKEANVNYTSLNKSPVVELHDGTKVVFPIELDESVCSRESSGPQTTTPMVTRTVRTSTRASAQEKVVAPLTTTLTITRSMRTTRTTYR